MLEIRDQNELRRFRKILTALDNSTVAFPVTVFRNETTVAAIMDGNDHRQVRAKMRDGRPHVTISDIKGNARAAWEQRDAEYEAISV